MPLSPHVSPEGAARAGRLLELSKRLAGSGRRGEALDASRKASEILRGLARVNPALHLADLAHALSVLAIRLREARRIREGVGISRERPRSDGA